MLGSKLFVVIFGALASIPGAVGASSLVSDFSTLKDAIHSTADSISRYDGSLIRAPPALMAVRKLQVAVHNAKSGLDSAENLQSGEAAGVTEECSEIMSFLPSTLDEIGAQISTFKNPGIKFVGYALLNAFKAEKDDMLDLLMAKTDTDQKSLLENDRPDVDSAFESAMDMAY